MSGVFLLGKKRDHQCSLPRGGMLDLYWRGGNANKKRVVC